MDYFSDYNDFQDMKKNTNHDLQIWLKISQEITFECDNINFRGRYSID